jgi:hypothetical protein
MTEAKDLMNEWSYEKQPTSLTDGSYERTESQTNEWMKS